MAFGGLDNGNVADAGGLVWMSGSQPTVGVISSANALMGSTRGDFSQFRIRALPNGNYVLLLDRWNNGSNGYGSVTLGNGSTGTFGIISSANSLVPEANDIGIFSFTWLYGSSNFVISRPNATVNGVTNAGAVTFGNGTFVNGTSTLTGVVSSANSLVGSKQDDKVGNNIFPLVNGNYVVVSDKWNQATGAITLGNGTTGVAGVLSEQNSLIGGTIGDFNNATFNT